MVPLIQDFNLLNIKNSIFPSYQFDILSLPSKQDEIHGSSVEALLITVSLFHDIACLTSSARNTSFLLQRCLTEIVLSKRMNVEVFPDDQPDNSFDDAIMIWLEKQPSSFSG